MATLNSILRKHKSKILVLFLATIIAAGIFISFFRVFIVWIPGWSIGVYESNEKFELKSIVKNPIFTKKDIEDHTTYFVADPFVAEENGMFYLFFEPGIKTDKGRKGVINLAISNDGINFDQKGTVLEDEVSISFPIIYFHEGNHYMTVEGREARNVRLYKAIEFPYQWTLTDTLITGNFGDPVVFHRDSVYYLFVSKPATHDAHLFISDSFYGPFVEHPKSPINVKNKRTGRMAGNILELNSKLYRPVQDCHDLYGEQVRLMEIVEINPDSYVERESSLSPVLVPGSEKWNSKKMHTMNIYDRKENGTFKIIADGDHLDYKPKIRIVRR